MAKLIDLNGLTHVYSIIKGMLADKLGKNDTAAAAIKDGAGNIIVDTYANKTDISGMVKSVNGTAPDASGNVNVEEYTHPNSGVTAGTYRSVTVNAQGHVTGGSNPTLAIANGGTDATTAENARINLGVNDFVTDLSVSGKTITYNKKDGTSGTITTQDTDTTYSAGAGISLSGTTINNSGVRSVVAGSSANQLSVNTNGTTATITINNVANATAASSATKATQDSAGQQINTTYIKGLSVSGKTITYTRGDGTTGTITTQDTNTDTKVINTLDNNNSFYLTGTTSDITNTGTQIFNNNVFYSEKDNAIVTPGLLIDRQGSDYIYATPDSIELSDRTNTGTLTATQYSGNAATATKATQDGNGNVITSTYVTNSTVGNAANKIPKYNAAGHLVLPDGSEFWLE